MKANASVNRIAPGVLRVAVDGRLHTVYVAGPPDDRWVFWDGRVFRPGNRLGEQTSLRQAGVAGPTLIVAAPMPATVISILARPERRVGKNETLVVLEAMKMELPLRAAADAIVEAVHCREGELVGAGQALVTMRPLPA
jgi:acetyl/propionyl-CoA carboxylase alpha subunit